MSRYLPSPNQPLLRAKSKLSFCSLLHYSRGLGVSSSFALNCKVLVERVGDLGVRLLCDGWKLRNWTQRGTRLKKTFEQNCVLLSLKGPVSGLPYSWKGWGLPQKKRWSSSSWHWQYSAPQSEHCHCLSSQRKAGQHWLCSASRSRAPTCLTNPSWPEDSWAMPRQKPKHESVGWWIYSEVKLITGLSQTERANCHLHPG